MHIAFSWINQMNGCAKARSGLCRSIEAAQTYLNCYIGLLSFGSWFEEISSGSLLAWYRRSKHWRGFKIIIKGGHTVSFSQLFDRDRIVLRRVQSYSDLGLELARHC